MGHARESSSQAERVRTRIQMVPVVDKPMMHYPPATPMPAEPRDSDYLDPRDLPRFPQLRVSYAGFAALRRDQIRHRPQGLVDRGKTADAEIALCGDRAVFPRWERAGYRGWTASFARDEFENHRY